MKCKIESENVAYQEHLENDYFISNNNGTLQYLLCMQIVLVLKEYNMKWQVSIKAAKNEGVT